MLSKLFHLPWPPEFFWPECPCCGITCSECTDLAPSVWKITVSGITNGDCSTCSVFNGTDIQLPDFGIDCTWASEPAQSSCFSPPGTGELWVLNTTFGVEWVLTAQGNPTIGRWTRSLASFDCLGSNVMTLASSSSQCNNLPSTITIAPA